MVRACILWHMHWDGMLLVRVGEAASGIKGRPAGVFEVNIVVLISLPKWEALSTNCDNLDVHVLLSCGCISSGKSSGRRRRSVRRELGGIRISWSRGVYLYV